MKALWLSVLIFTFVVPSVVQNIAGTCDIKLKDRDSTVTQFCLSALEKRFSPLNLNFNGSLLVFTPLPDNHQVEIKIHDGSDGLEPWANLANDFVDSLTSESLPYGKIRMFNS